MKLWIALGLLPVMIAACSSDAEKSEGTSSSSSGGSSSGEASSGGSSSGGSSGLTTTCEGACRQTTLTITKGATTDAFDRSQFGYEGNDKLFIEVRKGGVTGCPQQTSADPEFLLNVIVPRALSSTPIDQSAGAKANFLDLKGTIEEAPQPPKTTAVTITPIAAKLDGEGQFLAFDLHAELETGAVIDGHVFSSEHCTSLDD